MPMMSPGPIWAMLIICNACFAMGQNSAQQEAIEDIEQDWIMTCCGDEPIQDNRTLVTLGYLTAVKGDLRNR